MPTEKKIYRVLSEEPLTIDEVILKTQLPPSTVSATLFLMEMKRLVKALPGQRYVRR
jgi:DNA processing protein